MTPLTCGIDVGGSKIAGGVVDVEGTVVERIEVASPADDGRAIVAAISGLVDDLGSRHDVAAVGIGAAGYVDRHRARVRAAPNLAWRDVDLRTEIEGRTGHRVVVENDANAAAWGEFVSGAGQDVDDFLLVTVGTGVGGGVVLDGELLRGAHGVAAEVGHVRVVRDGILCGCGVRGCLEAYGSGTALVRRARLAAADGAPGARDLLERAGGVVEAIDGPLITETAEAGDRFATDLLAETGTWLGEGIASLVAVLDPAVVAIGGGVGGSGGLVLEPLRAAFERHLTGRDHRPVAEIREAALGASSGIVGAADLARR